MRDGWQRLFWEGNSKDVGKTPVWEGTQDWSNSLFLPFIINDDLRMEHWSHCYSHASVPHENKIISALLPLVELTISSVFSRAIDKQGWNLLNKGSAFIFFFLFTRIANKPWFYINHTSVGAAQTMAWRTHWITLLSFDTTCSHLWLLLKLLCVAFLIRFIYWLYTYLTYTEGDIISGRIIRTSCLPKEAQGYGWQGSHQASAAVTGPTCFSDRRKEAVISTSVNENGRGGWLRQQGSTKHLLHHILFLTLGYVREETLMSDCRNEGVQKKP